MAALSLLIGVALANSVGALFSEDHWTYSKEITAENADAFVKENVDSGKTQHPAWADIVKKFHGNEDVVFGDVTLSKNQVREIHGTAQNPGAGGWPTIRHFNKETGYGGQAYAKKTSSAMCDELGPKEGYMQMYVEEAGGTSLCNVKNTDAGCSDKEKDFIGKWSSKAKDELQKQVDRLSGMVSKDGGAMKPEALTWAKQRLAIVKQLHKKEEL